MHPIDALGINYQAGVQKMVAQRLLVCQSFGRWLWQIYILITGAITTPACVFSRRGLCRPTHRHRPDARFHERRIYGNDAYSYTNGARFYWNRWHTPRLQSLTALEIGRLKNMQRARSDIDSRLASGSLGVLYQCPPIWAVGLGFLSRAQGSCAERQFQPLRRPRGVVAQWPKGISTRVQAGLAQRHYQTASLFSDGGKTARHRVEHVIIVMSTAPCISAASPRGSPWLITATTATMLFMNTTDCALLSNSTKHFNALICGIIDCLIEKAV